MTQEARHKILTVGGTQQGSSALKQLLRELDVDIIPVETGTAALAGCAKHNVILILIEESLPGRENAALVERLREGETTRLVPVIFLSSSEEDPVQFEDGYHQWGVDFLVRPYNPEILLGKARFFLELARHEDRLKRLTEKQTAKWRECSRELDAFTHSVSHDLRAPLRSIDGFSQAFVEDYGHRVDKMGLDYLERVRAAAKNMNRLIDDLMGFSRLTRIDPHEVTVDLSSMSREIIEDLGENEPDRQMEVEIEDGLRVKGDPTLLRSALQNLLENSWKFTSNRKRGRIQVGRRDTEESTTFFVRDNGAGFDMAYADRLFGVGERLHTPEEFPGTGIGLAAVKRVIEKHGGRVWGESELGQGATFTFTLGEQ